VKEKEPFLHYEKKKRISGMTGRGREFSTAPRNPQPRNHLQDLAATNEGKKKKKRLQLRQPEKKRGEKLLIAVVRRKKGKVKSLASFQQRAESTSTPWSGEGRKREERCARPISEKGKRV